MKPGLFLFSDILLTGGIETESRTATQSQARISMRSAGSVQRRIRQHLRFCSTVQSSVSSAFKLRFSSAQLHVYIHIATTLTRCTAVAKDLAFFGIYIYNWIRQAQNLQHLHGKKIPFSQKKAALEVSLRPWHSAKDSKSQCTSWPAYGYKRRSATTSYYAGHAVIYDTTGSLRLRFDVTRSILSNESSPMF